ncbi:MAG: helix-turn-helix domain-containing protein [Ferruginibacter sp.]
MVIHIKYMVSERCRMLVKKILDQMELVYDSVELGVVELKRALTKAQKDTLKNSLKIWGLVLIDDPKKVLVEKIKNSIINLIHNDTTICSIKPSSYLSEYLNYNYTYLANVFSQETGTCLSDFIIAHKIKKAKEMLIYEGLSVSEIAWKLNYSSVAHLSNQFTRIAGLRPSQFKKNNGNLFIPLEQIGRLEAV